MKVENKDNLCPLKIYVLWKFTSFENLSRQKNIHGYSSLVKLPQYIPRPFFYDFMILINLKNILTYLIIM